MSLPFSRLVRWTILAYTALGIAAWGWSELAGHAALLRLPSAWLPWSSSTRMAASVGGGLLLAAIVIATTRWLVRRAAWAADLERQLGGLVGPLSSTDCALVAIASGVGEELFFRGAMQPALGLWLTSLVFGALHFAPRAPFSAWGAWAAVVGLCLGALFELTGWLPGSIVAHVSINHVNLRTIAAKLHCS